MICPMCFGKGYATDEDIKEYPHKCPNCHGKGFYSVDWQKVRCEVCNGSGKKPLTNEEWFCNLSTEEKADALTHKIMDIICWNNDPKPSEVYITIKNWLKREHE